MRVFNPHGSKARLFEMMTKVGNLNEQILPKEKKEEVIKNFVGYVAKRLDLDSAPKVILSYNGKEAGTNKSFGRFAPEKNELRVVMANRNLADVLRTIAHELIHYKQNKDGKLGQNSGETGSEQENEANALAGVFMRDFGRDNPIIFE